MDDEVDTMVVVDLDIIGSSNVTAVPCLKLLKEAGAKIIHKEDLWNGFKKSEVVQINLQLVMRSYSGYVDGVYFDGTPAALTPIFGEVRDSQMIFLNSYSSKNRLWIFDKSIILTIFYGLLRIYQAIF